MLHENISDAEDLSAQKDQSVSDSNDKADDETILSSLTADIDTAFPLSGGEPDVDFIDLEIPDSSGNESVIAQFIQGLDTAFPLSGGEEDIEFIEFELPEIDLSGDADQPTQHKGGNSLLDDLDTSFPLSGGES